MTQTATVTVTITGANDAPVAIDDASVTDEDTVLTVAAAPGMLANDSDPDANDVLQVSAVNGSAAAPPLDLAVSRQFANWLAGGRLGLAFTTCQSGPLSLCRGPALTAAY